MLRTLISRRTTAHVGGHTVLRSASKVATQSPVPQTGASYNIQKDTSSCVTRSLGEFMKDGRLTLRATASTDEKDRKAAAKAHNTDVTRLLASSARVLLVYPDGSRRPSMDVYPRVGAAAVGFLAGSTGGLQEVFARSRRLKGSASLQMAEVVGAHIGVEDGIEYAKRHDVKHLRIHPDDDLVVRCLQILGGGRKRDVTGQYTDILNRMYGFLRGDPSRSILVEWVPAHCGIPGNARAHQLAKAVTKVAGENAGAGVGVVAGMREQSSYKVSKQL
ncbi:uncharacterized protein SCHCODRAFT_02634716 [Schizophyllum commune H4-8]|nr:uncharacterized protein SCHCODRAFT_02634716 [Schizophyllum commune H4-8]KAI5889498.1 hypothetical protein SCHCODRAFT_02634716 [Schizophyllum commune H4-8]